MTESNAFAEARTYWTIRAGQTQRQLQKEAREAFKDQLGPKAGPQTRNVNDLADGRTIALWVAAAITDREWGERMVAWTLSADDPNVQAAMAEIRRVMSFALPDAAGSSTV